MLRAPKKFKSRKKCEKLLTALPSIRLLNQLKKLAGKLFVLSNQIERISDLLLIIATLLVTGTEPGTAPEAEPVSAVRSAVIIPAHYR